MRNFKRSYSRGFRGRSNGQRRNWNRGASLDPQMFVKKANGVQEVPYVSTNSFSDFPLDETVKRNVIGHRFTEPTAIQDQAILPILEGKDLVGVANTGTGKTAAFLLPLITKVARDRNQKVLIVTPTRELAAQIQAEFKLFSSGMRLYSVLCIGGTSLGFQSRELSRQPNFVIGTPGRLKDLEKRQVLNLNHYRNVVLDEVDRMLDMGFIRDIQHIVALLPRNRQSLFFSATLPKETRVVMQAFLTEPIVVSVKTGQTPQNVDQDVILTRGKNKLEILQQLLIKEEFRKVLVFGRTKWGIKNLEAGLVRTGLKVMAIHGNKSQSQRSRALNMLKTNQVQVLLATDVASRGLDIEDITHVINYDVPETYDDYVHRIGRTGRAGKKGIALTFID